MVDVENALGSCVFGLRWKRRSPWWNSFRLEGSLALVECYIASLANLGLAKRPVCRRMRLSHDCMGDHGWSRYSAAGCRMIASKGDTLSSCAPRAGNN